MTHDTHKPSFYFFVIAAAIAIGAATFVLHGCSSEPVSQAVHAPVSPETGSQSGGNPPAVQPIPTYSPVAQSVPSPVPTLSGTLPTVTRGWLSAYTDYVKANVPATLLAYPPTSVCPKYAQLSDDGKRTFWADWLESTASPESGFNRTDLYYEHGIGDPDAVTGLHNVSEGLLQLSYGDYQCKGVFDYPKDKAAFLDDYKKLAALDTAKPEHAEIYSAHPERTILDPYKNLQCGLNILNTFFAGHPERSFQKTAGQYWSTVAKGDVLSYFNAHFKAVCQ